MLHRSILFAFTLLLSTFIHAQLPDGSIAPDFIVTDLNGEEHSLYPILESGKSVILDFSATWCGLCWNYHNSHAIEDAFTMYGPTGMDISTAFFLEADNASNDDCVLGNSMCNTSSIGDWTAGTSYPVVNLTGDELAVKSDYDISSFPTIIAIAPNKKMYETGKINADVWSSWLTETLALDGSIVITDYDIDLTVTGGFEEVSYEWSNGETTEDITGVEPGFYSVTITEGRGHSIELLDIEVTVPLPTISCPPNVAAICSSDEFPPSSSLEDFEVAGGIVDGEFDPASFALISIVIDGNSCPETETRTYGVEGDDGTLVVCEQILEVFDEIAPSLTLPTDMTLEELPTPYQTLEDVTMAGGSASDNCGIDPASITFLSEITDDNLCALVTRVYSVSDFCGNTATAEQAFRIGLSDEASVSFTFSNSGLDYEFFSEANFGDEYQWVISNGATANVMNLPMTFEAPGIYEVCLTVNSACGSLTYCEDIDAKIDGVSVIFSCPAQVSNLCAIEDAPIYASIEEYQNDGGLVNGDYQAATFELVDETSDNEACPETITRTYSVLDVNGDAYTCEHLLTVNDLQAPVMSTLGSLIVPTIADQVYQDVADFYDAAGTLDDNCGLDESSFALLSQFIEIEGPCEQWRRVYTVGDACGNTSTTDQVVYVELSDEAEISFTSDATELLVDFTLTSNFGSEYEWMFGDGNMSEEENPSHTYAADGMYEVCVKVTSTCGSKQYCEEVNVMINNTAEYEQGAQLISIAPNPASDYIQLNIDETLQIDEIELMSIAGKLIDINTTKTHSQNITLTGLQSGTYFLRVRSGNEYFYKKIMVQ